MILFLSLFDVVVVVVVDDCWMLLELNIFVLKILSVDTRLSVDLSELGDDVDLEFELITSSLLLLLLLELSIRLVDWWVVITRSWSRLRCTIRCGDVCCWARRESTSNGNGFSSLFLPLLLLLLFVDVKKDFLVISGENVNFLAWCGLLWLDLLR